LKRILLIIACGLAGLGACRSARRPAADASGDGSACDEYYQKMMRCLESDRWPEQTRREGRESFTRLRQNEQAATTREAREMHESTCRMGIEMMQQGYGSRWICPGIW
jgi:hypothetical protein